MDDMYDNGTDFLSLYTSVFDWSDVFCVQYANTPCIRISQSHQSNLAISLRKSLRGPTTFESLLINSPQKRIIISIRINDDLPWFSIN